MLEKGDLPNKSEAAVVNRRQIAVSTLVHAESVGMMCSIGAECGGQFRRQLHPLRFQFFERLRHRMSVVENHQVGNQMIVLDDFQLIFAHNFLNGVRSEIGPLRNIVETFTVGITGRWPSRAVDHVKTANYTLEFSDLVLDLFDGERSIAYLVCSKDAAIRNGFNTMPTTA